MLIPVKKPKTEDDHQALVITWANAAVSKYPCLRWLYHIPNERKCTAQQGARLKRIGVKRGVSDLCLPYPVGSYHGLYIEMKTPNGRPTEDQKRFVSYLHSVGYAVKVCLGYEDAIDTLKAYLGGETIGDR
jgi:hypothetical protein